ncbi:tRNA lysidine(34) synthetase TilS [Heyndrickxia acidiproducens]|uniref:tRNA lysidine(34) synthetase TilS n=1 Tax=Heyndrickxia acidiproducens TaxID=1121084 RepID=UPI000363ACE7|nr:tRNA lysidine(34) synthetase TilS [Heyndrickxia acidiproducens]
MLPFEANVSDFIKKHQLISEGDHLIAAVSGGPDSLALLHFLKAQSKSFKIKITAAHLDHMIRGKESYEDMMYVERICNHLHIEYRAKRIPIPEKAASSGLGLEETARKYRYGFLKDVLAETGANKVVFGHHGDDQIETILMRLTRGTSEKGRAGIPFRRPFYTGEIIRPLLGTTKKEIEEYCLHYQLHPRIDASNYSLDYTRNRFRSVILPFLKKENPHAHKHFQRFSEELLEDEAFLESLSQKHLEESLDTTGRDYLVDLPAFKRAPLPLQRRGIHLILKYLYNQNVTELTAIHTEAIFNLFYSRHPSGRLDLPGGLKVLRNYERCVFTFQLPPRSTSYQYLLYEGMEIRLPNQDRIKLKKKEISYSYRPENMLLLHINDISLPLIVRNRKPGDRIEAKGLNGSKKVKDIFIDEKIPKPERDSWPVVTDSSGKILWLPNLKKSRYEPIDVLPDETYYILQYCKQTSSRGQSHDEA